MSGNNLNVDVRVDVIYFDMPADWAVESELHGASFDLRLLTQTAENKAEALRALGKAVHRSESIIIIGGFHGKEHIPAAIAHALDRKMQRIGLANTAPEDAVYIPEGGTPIVHEGKIRGAILKSGPQAIFLVDETRDFRAEILRESVIPHIAAMHGLSLTSEAVDEEDAPEEAAIETETIAEQTAVVEKVLTETSDDEDPYSIENIIRQQTKEPIEELPLINVQLGAKDEPADLPQDFPTSQTAEEEKATSLDSLLLDFGKNTQVAPTIDVEDDDMQSDFERQTMSLADIKLDPTEAPIHTELELTDPASADFEEPEEPAAPEHDTAASKESQSETEPEETEEPAAPEHDTAAPKESQYEPEPEEPEEPAAPKSEETEETEEVEETQPASFTKGLKIALFAAAAILLAAALYFGYQTFV